MRLHRFVLIRPAPGMMVYSSSGKLTTDKYLLPGYPRNPYKAVLGFSLKPEVFDDADAMFSLAGRASMLGRVEASVGYCNPNGDRKLYSTIDWREFCEGRTLTFEEGEPDDPEALPADTTLLTSSHSTLIPEGQLILRQAHRCLTTGMYEGSYITSFNIRVGGSFGSEDREESIRDDVFIKMLEKKSPTDPTDIEIHLPFLANPSPPPGLSRRNEKAYALYVLCSGKFLRFYDSRRRPIKDVAGIIPKEMEEALVSQGI